MAQRLLVVLGAICGLYFAIAFADMALAAQRMSSRAESIEAELRSLERENQRLRAEASYLQSDEAIERLAREHLGWARPGEIAVLTITPTPSVERSRATPR
ncbi:MAG: septum formation initiator family protein [Chloroflexi bacterium]|nr:septum formation initiator family protein [Chloroflexota bacterium]